VTGVTGMVDVADVAGVTGVAPVRAFLVDVWETLVEPGFHDRFAALAGLLGVEAAVWEAEWYKGREDRDRGRLTVAGSFARTLPAVGIEPDPELVGDLVRRDRELMLQRCRLFDDALPFLAGLRGRGIAVALVSNCANTTRPLLDHLGVIALADAVVLSCEVGSAKPFPDIYQTALDDLGVAAADAVFIDDTPSFCVGAEAVGVRAIQISRGTGNGQDGAKWGFPVVKSLFDVEQLI
jgi:putative hydrolase of the HAD superfamily